MSEILCTVAPKKRKLAPLGTTVVVSMDEPCLGLTEQNIQSPGSKGLHRYKTLAVVRAGKLVTYLEDMGPVENWPNCGQFRIPGGPPPNAQGRIEVVHTVGELYDIANYLRHGFCPPPDDLQPIGIWDRVVEQAEEKQRLRRHASSFGKGVKIQRS